jgi:chemotaxis protein MotB
MATNVKGIDVMRVYTWTILAGLILSSMGCVAQRELDDIRTLYRQSEAQKLDLQARLEEAEQRVRHAQDSDPSPQLQFELAAAIAERDKLKGLLEEALENLNSIPQIRLPAEIDQALKTLAAGNPQLMSYDPLQGMVRLHSDLTFALGSTRVSSGATQTMATLAGVLNSIEAQPYEVRVAGHTDNVPVKNPANKQKFGDNWGLSAFRAIAVKSVLEKAGVSPQRLSVAGYGKYRPIAPNGLKGAEANRRVEIYLVEMSGPSSAGAALSDAGTLDIADAPIDLTGSNEITPLPVQDDVMYK